MEHRVRSRFVPTTQEEPKATFTRHTIGPLEVVGAVLPETETDVPRLFVFYNATTIIRLLDFSDSKVLFESLKKGDRIICANAIMDVDAATASNTFEVFDEVYLIREKEIVKLA